MNTRSELSQSIRFIEPRIFLEVSLSQVFFGAMETSLAQQPGD